MGFLATKLPIVGFALAALLGLACVNLFLENSRLEGENSVLDKDIGDLKEKNERLTKDYATVKNNLNACNSSFFTKRSYKSRRGKDRRYSVKRGRAGKEDLRQR